MFTSDDEWTEKDCIRAAHLLQAEEKMKKKKTDSKAASLHEAGERSKEMTFWKHENSGNARSGYRLWSAHRRLSVCVLCSNDR